MWTGHKDPYGALPMRKSKKQQEKRQHKTIQKPSIIIKLENIVEKKRISSLVLFGTIWDITWHKTLLKFSFFKLYGNHGIMWCYMIKATHNFCLLQASCTTKVAYNKVVPSVCKTLFFFALYDVWYATFI